MSLLVFVAVTQIWYFRVKVVNYASCSWIKKLFNYVVTAWFLLFDSCITFKTQILYPNCHLMISLRYMYITY